MADAVRIEMAIERYNGDATKCSGYNATRTAAYGGGCCDGNIIYDPGIRNK